MNAGVSTDPIPFLDLAAPARGPAPSHWTWRGRPCSGTAGSSAALRWTRSRPPSPRTATSTTASVSPTARTRSSSSSPGCGIGPGDEVIVPTNTFVATAEAVVAVGATPRFVDVLPDTLLIDPAATAAAVGPRTAAIMAVHLYGQVADMTALSAVATRHGLALIEDAAQAHGARFEGRPAGSCRRGRLVQLLPGQEPRCARRRRRRGVRRRRAGRAHPPAGRPRALRRSTATRTNSSGRNSRLDTLQAAVLQVKLPVAGRREPRPGRRRRALSADVAGVVPPGGGAPGRRARLPPCGGAGSGPCRGDARTRRGGHRLGDPLPRAVPPAAGVRRPTRPEPLPVAEAAADHILSLPLSPDAQRRPGQPGR